MIRMTWRSLRQSLVRRPTKRVIAVYYEIFVRSFADSDGDGIGDLNGVTEKLDYLKELGIDGIWFMPITASDTYHGYSVTDYMAVNPDYGTEDDLKRLLDEAHSRDMKVIMDLVINHTSINHPWFQAAKSDENSEYRDYYRWVYKTDKKDCNHLLDKSSWGDMVWHQEGDFYYYGVFGADMPDLNYNNPDVRQAAKDAAGHWLELGLDGFVWTPQFISMGRMSSSSRKILKRQTSTGGTNLPVTARA